jgi:hypothetical protein
VVGERDAAHDGAGLTAKFESAQIAIAIETAHGARNFRRLPANYGATLDPHILAGCAALGPAKRDSEQASLRTSTRPSTGGPYEGPGP